MKMVVAHYGKESRGFSRWECRPDLSEVSVKEFIDDDYFTIDDYVMVDSRDAHLFAELLNYGCDKNTAIEIINMIIQKKED